MPRLDWQLWFEALRWERFAGARARYQPTPWFGSFLERLVAREPSVLALLGPDPLGGRKAVAARTTLFDYRFTTRAEHAETGAWWVRRQSDPTWLEVRLAPAAHRP
jgi:hypothetical protein